jgi:hypothetical protein
MANFRPHPQVESVAIKANFTWFFRSNALKAQKSGREIAAVWRHKQGRKFKVSSVWSLKNDPSSHRYRPDSGAGPVGLQHL